MNLRETNQFLGEAVEALSEGRHIAVAEKIARGIKKAMKNIVTFSRSPAGPEMIFVVHGRAKEKNIDDYFKALKKKGVVDYFDIDLNKGQYEVHAFLK